MPRPELRINPSGVKRWRVRFRIEGKQHAETFPTPAGAENFCRLIDALGPTRALAELHAEEPGTEPTLDQWAPIHFAALTDANADTINRYRNIYARDWSPSLGHLRLSQITRSDIGAALNRVGGSDKTRKNKWAVLAHMFKLAAEEGLIARSPAIGFKLGVRTSHEAVEHRYLTEDEFWTLLTQTPDHWKPLIAFLGGSAARWGEAAALNVGDIDPRAMTVRIVKAEKRDPDQPSKRIVGPTKTKKSKRTVTLPREVVDYLKPLLDRPKHARLFLPPKGGELRHKTFYTDIWLKKCVTGLEPKPRIHDLRHSHVAWLIAAGAPLPVIQARLGHEKITTTIDTYGHLLPDIQQAAADAAGLVFQRPHAIEASK